MPETISIALPPALRDLLAQAASAQHVTQDRMAGLLLDQQITTAAAHVSAERAAQILGHPRLTSAWPNPAIIHLDRASNDRAAALATQFSALRGQKIVKGQLIQALLWQAVEPADADTRRSLRAPPPPRSSVTVSVPAELNTMLLDLSAAAGSSRTALISELLDVSLNALGTDTDAMCAALAACPTTPSTATTSTVHLSRAYDAPVQAVADQIFTGVKSRALQALLGYALQHRVASTDPLPDRQVLISGVLYARIVHLTRGDTTPIRTFVEQALEHEVTRAEARRKRQ